MQLVTIDPKRYRKHLNKVIFACIGALSIGSLSVSQLLIKLFPATDGSHFHWNLLGVIIAGILVLSILIKQKSKPFMYEVSYVWDLKQTLNKINRKMKKLEEASKTGDKVALNILNFSYSGSRQLWLLDNNTITINHLSNLENKLNTLAEQHNVTLDVNLYDSSQLTEY